MNTPNHHGINFPRLAGMLCAALGLFVLAGWALAVPSIKSVLPRAVEMKANTALCLLLGGLALILLDAPASPRQRIGQALALIVAAVGFATMAQYAFGWQLGIDELLFRDTLDAFNPYRGRMSPYSTVAFAAIGLGLLALHARSLRWFVWLAANLTILLGAVSFIGYVWNASEIVTDRLVPPVAINTAVAFILLGAGMSVATRRPEERKPFRLSALSPVESKTLAGFVATLLLLLLAGGLTYRAAVEAAESAHQVELTQQIRGELARLYAAVSDAESQQRIYLLSGDPEHLARYQSHAHEANAHAGALADLVEKNPSQLQRLKTLQDLINERVQLLDHTTTTFERSGLAAAQSLIIKGEGHECMSDIRDLVDRMDAEEAERLKARSTDTAAKQFGTLLSLLATLAVASAGFMVLYTGIRRELANRARAEAALRRSEESLAVTLHSIGDAVLATDTEGRVTWLNPIAEQLTGWTHNEAQGRPVAEVFRIINEETRQPAVIPVERVLATGEIHGLANHTIIIARDGTERPIADSAAPIRDKEGRTLGVVLVFRDVTMEKQAERTIRESDALNRAVLNAVMANIAVVNRHGTIIAVNENWERFARENGADPASPQVAVGANYLQVCEHAARDLGGEAQTILNGIRGVLSRKDPIFRYEYPCHSPTEQRWFSMQVSPLPRAEGGAVIAQINITERKRAEEQIRSFNLELGQLVEQRTAEVRQALDTLDATDDGAFIFEPETLLNIYVNEGAVRQLGYTKAELLTMTAVDFKPEFTEASYRKMLAPIIQGQSGSHRFTTMHRHKDGHDFPVEINLQYVAPPGEHPRCIAIVRDITERKKAERQTLRSQRLESIGTLASGVAHDLNNALAPIMMGIGMLKAKHPQDSRTFDMLEASAKRGADMVRQLLGFAKGMEGERVSLHPGHLVREIESLIRGSFPKNIQLVVKRDPKLSPVLGDATQLHQVLLNLCVNSRDAMPHGGTLTLEAENKELDATYVASMPDARPGKFLVLRVRDTGTGIPPEVLDRIFDPFFTTKGPDKGTGLGLSTVMGIVKGHGGFMQVYSQPGKGSTFAVHLPTELETSDTEHLPKTAAQFAGQGETILVVDDEAGVREVSRAVLRHLNFKPVTATDGTDGLIQAAQCRAELRAIITDLHMPHMDGLAFVRALRRMLPDLPVVVASGRMEDSIASEFRALGVTAFLPKPFTEAQLAEILKNLLAGK